MPSYTNPIRIDQRMDSIERELDSTQTDPEVKKWANGLLRDIQRELDQVLAHDEGFENHLLAYVNREVERSQVDDVDASPYDSERETPICGCDDLGCPLKRGELPATIRHADSLTEGIKQFQQEHGGRPHVLLEGDEAYSEKRGDVWYVVRRINTYLRAYRIADDGDGPELPSPEEVHAETANTQPAAG